MTLQKIHHLPKPTFQNLHYILKNIEIIQTQEHTR